MNEIRIGLIGSGFMGRAHAIAYREVGAVFDLPAPPVLEMMAEIDARTAKRAAARAAGLSLACRSWGRLLRAKPDLPRATLTPLSANLTKSVGLLRKILRCTM